MSIRLIAVFLFCILLGAFNPISAQPNSDTTIIHRHLTAITKTPQFRHYKNIQQLNKTAAYIHAELANYCDTVFYQEYVVAGKTYKNVIGSIGIRNSERIVVGAHYDVCGDQEGADDNASGVAGVLELARLLKNKDIGYQIDFVAYSLEEPPFFRTKHMGSYVHAKSLNDANVALKGMICLEMIGFFSDEPKSQTYPLPHKKIIYGDEADYIMIVQKMGNNAFSNRIKSGMKRARLIDTKSIKAMSSIPGIDFSDHRNYWAFGYDALMVTNTSFYRNPHYHKPTDTMETLNLAKMAFVIDEVYYALINFKTEKTKKAL